jgi:hypothetical protein
MINLSKIQIGKSENNFCEFFLDSQQKIKSVIMDPFGSNKMRFHFPPMLNFDVSDIGKNKYKISIEKKNKNLDLSNSQFFCSSGWTNELYITCLMDDFILDKNYIENYIPNNYGSVKIELKNIDNAINKFKIGIVIPTFGRYDYLKLCFESLNNANLSDCLLIIIDESMTKDIDQDKIASYDFINSFNFNITTIKIHKNAHGNMFDSIRVGLDILAHLCEFVMTIDSDTIHNKNFINNVINTYVKIKSDNQNKLVVVSGFNTDKHKFVPNDNLDWYIKDTIGGCHLCFNSEDYWKYIRYTLISHKWDTNIYNLVNRELGIIAVTKPSVIEHIGENSSVRKDNIPYDKSIDFKRDDLNINDNINTNFTKKFYIISEDFEFENNQTWIIDVFKNEFIEYSGLEFVDEPIHANIIWIIGININKINHLKTICLDNKQIITTIHHIDWEKINIFNENFNIVKDISTKFHVICEKVYFDLIKLTSKPIVISNFWINENLFYNIPNKNSLRIKYQIPVNSYCIGSFQRDTEGKNKCMKPKLSKGPDIFVKNAIDIKLRHDNLIVILTGRKRNYIIEELEKNSINYKYFQMTTTNELNELYNCLDLYIVSSRVEGGPRAILECGISKTPIISTNVGISNLILNPTSIYDSNVPLSYRNAKPDIEYAYDKSNKYSIKNYLVEFIKTVF